MRFVTRGILLVVAAAVLMVGCGDSEDSPETVTTSSLNKAQWIKRAAAICLSGGESILGRVSAYEEENVAKTPRGNEIVAGEAIKLEVPPILSEQAERIRALGAPAGDEEQIEAFLRAMEADIQGIEDGPLLTGLLDVESKFRRSGKLARAYGLGECAYG